MNMRLSCKNCPEIKKGQCSYACIKEPTKILFNGENYTKLDIRNLIQKRSGIRIGLNAICNNVRELEKHIQIIDYI